MELNEDAESAALNTGKDKRFTFCGHVAKSRTSRWNQIAVFYKQAARFEGFDPSVVGKRGQM